MQAHEIYEGGTYTDGFGRSFTVRCIKQGTVSYEEAGKTDGGGTCHSRATSGLAAFARMVSHEVKVAPR